MLRSGCRHTHEVT